MPEMVTLNIAVADPYPFVWVGVGYELTHYTVQQNKIFSWYLENF